MLKGKEASTAGVLIDCLRARKGVGQLKVRMFSSVVIGSWSKIMLVLIHWPNFSLGNEILTAASR